VPLSPKAITRAEFEEELRELFYEKKTRRLLNTLNSHRAKTRPSSPATSGKSPPTWLSGDIGEAPSEASLLSPRDPGGCQQQQQDDETVPMFELE
jgi:hypothetical protein